MSEKQEKKAVGRADAIALGIICIILAVGFVVAVVNYTSIIGGKDNTITSLSSQISSLQSQVNDLVDITSLAKSTVWVSNEAVNQPSGSYDYWARSASYAGYVWVNVQTSTTTNTYVRVIYSSHGVNYDNHIEVGTGGTAVFPILPASNIEIRVGNTNLFNAASETVSITYYY
jgi:hypothetical protein